MKLILKSVLLILIIGLLFPLETVNAVPPTAQQFYGDVTLDGSPAPDGTSVTAKMNGRTAGSDSTSGGSYSLTINTIDGDQAGDSISFYVDGLSAGSTSLNPGAITSRNLSATSPTPTYTLTVQRSGNGSVSPSIGTHSYNEDTQVNVSASPSSGWAFDSWTGDVADPNSASTSVFMDDDKTITANFIELPPGETFTLTIETTGEGSTSPSPGTREYAEDREVSVSATPDEGWKFDSWTGDVADPNSASTSVVMDDDKTITANFVLLIDETPPVISGVHVKSITKTSATVVWVTNERSTSFIEYQPGDLSAGNTDLVTLHPISLTGLQPATEYTFRVKSTDGAGNESISDEYTFTTDGSPASFQISDWRFDLVDTTEGGKQLTVEYIVTNTGDVAGNYTAELKIDGTTEDSVELTVNPQSSEVVKMTATKTEIGTYLASVEGVSFNFSISALTQPDGDDDGFPWLPVGIGAFIVLAIVLTLVLLSRTHYLFLFVRKQQ